MSEYDDQIQPWLNSDLHNLYIGLQDGTISSVLQQILQDLNFQNSLVDTVLIGPYATVALTKTAYDTWLTDNPDYVEINHDWIIDEAGQYNIFIRKQKIV